MPTFNDIWAKVLLPDFMNVLTETSEGRQKLRHIQIEKEMAGFEIENATALFTAKTKNQPEIETFKNYLSAQKHAYKEKLQKQQYETFKRQQQERQEQEKRRAEEER